MGTTYLIPGEEFMMDKNKYQIDRYVDDELQLIDVKTKRATQIRVDEVIEKISNGEIQVIDRRSRYVPESISNGKDKKIAAHLEFYSKSLQDLMKVRRTYIEGYFKRCGDKRSTEVIKNDLNAFWDKQWGSIPHPSSVARWIKRYIESGRDIRSLAPSHFLKGNRTARYDKFIIEACQLALKKIYLKPERGSINLTYTEVVDQILRENLMRPDSHKLAKPSKALLNSLIKDLPAYDVYAARYGKSAADHKFRNAVHSAPVEGPLRRVEVDHTQLDIIVVHPVSGIVLGRPWITLIIDVYTRCILGFTISFDPPSHMVVARALKMALLPKVNIKSRWPIVSREWPMFGLMMDLVADNGLEFHGMSLEDVCYTLGINISYCPRKKGWWKAVIERAIGTLNRNVTDGMPGRTFSSIDEKGDYEPQKNAVLSIEALEQIIAKWIVDIYHETVHETLGRKPRSVWEQEVNIQDIPIVTNVHELDAIMGIVEKRALSTKGIEINNLRYNCDELGGLLDKFGTIQELTIKWNPEEMGHIHVLPNNGSFIKVPVISFYEDYAVGISHYQHEHYKAYGKKYLTELDDDQQLFQAKAKLHEYALNESQKTINSKKKLKRLAAQSAKTKSKAQQEQIIPALTASYVPDTKDDIIPNFKARNSDRRSM